MAVAFSQFVLFFNSLVFFSIFSSRKDKLAVELEKLTLSDQQDKESEDSAKDTVCPLCGLVYGTDNSVWICCDTCDT